MGRLPPRRAEGQPSVGVLYLLLTSATSTPGKLSSLARAQAAFFSLLLRRLAAALDRGEGEEAIRRELTEAWEIRGEAGISAALQGARGYWRRLREPNLGLGSLPIEPGEWMAENGLADEMTAARGLFPEVTGHLEALVERLAAVEVLRDVAGDESTGALATIQGSVAAALGGITPWEAEALRPAQPLLASLAAWSGRLSLLGGGETPTTYPGRERLADWIGEALGRSASDGGSGNGEGGEDSAASLPPARRLAVGGDTYLMFGVDDSAPSEAVSIELAAPRWVEEVEIILAVRFGGEERAFHFDLSDGKDLLAAVRLALRRLALPSARRSPPRGLGGARPGVSSREIRRRGGPGPLGHPQEPGVAPSRQEGASSGVSPSQTRTRHIAATLMSRVAAMIPKTQSHPFGTASESQPKNQA